MSAATDSTPMRRPMRLPLTHPTCLLFTQAVHQPAPASAGEVEVRLAPGGRRSRGRRGDGRQRVTGDHTGRGSPGGGPGHGYHGRRQRIVPSYAFGGAPPRIPGTGGAGMSGPPINSTTTPGLGMVLRRATPDALHAEPRSSPAQVAVRRTTCHAPRYLGRWCP